MPGSATAIRQERLKKTHARPIPLGLFTINEEDEQQKNGNSRRPKAPDGCKVQEKKTPSRPASTVSGQNSNHSGNKPDPPPVLRVDDRQRLARERREEREKQLAAREIVWLEREERARQHYERHLEARKKKLEDQRLKEERRRAAVEEKRRQRLEEDKERHEAVVRRTMERSQKPKQKYNRWSWGAPLHGSPTIHSAARRLQLSPWESSVVNRLLTPTHSFLARSKSTAALSGDTASCSPIIMPFKAAHSRNAVDRPKLFVTPPEGSARRKTIHGIASHKRDREREHTPFHFSSGFRRTLSPSNPKARSPAPARLWLPSKSMPHLPGTPRPASSLPPGSVKATSTQARPSSPGNIRPVKREVKVEPEKKDPEKKVASEPSVKGRAPLGKVEEVTAEEGTPVEPTDPAVPVPTPAPAPAPAPVSTPSSTVAVAAVPKAPAGTTDPEEATRLLAEKRRLAREQREKEERERREKEELERQKIEELARRMAEERSRREEESRRLEAEQAREKEELALRLAAEERERCAREEAERVQKQKEEEARAREEAERARQEREKHFQKEEQERLERKKRLEEIMRRTRRTETADKKTTEQRNGDITKGVLTGETEVSSLPCMNSPGHGESADSPRGVTLQQSEVTTESSPISEKQPNENGMSVQNENFEEIINLPVGSRASRLDVTNNENPEIPLKPILAFNDEGTLGPLPQVDGVQTQQTAEVI
ncbi:ensconsin isoform X4 [Peromyscus californicus insignis]|uniref:ensconsin isoform X4 n=1 Tax=Peromyscus californicus insignis TaxID=564181 RepID=UPI0022A7FE7F|nr:ensconsin isoform X4 [Peromyscus californicus insignis]